MMKPDLKHLSHEANEAFFVRYVDESYYPVAWHFHPEYELVLVIESTGQRVVGDRVMAFGPGDLVLLGPNLPHLWRNDPVYYQEASGLRARSIIVQFSERAFGESFFCFPETNKFQNLFRQAQSGINITGRTNKKVTAQLFALSKLTGFSRWLKLLEILNTIVESTDYELICNQGINIQHRFDTDKLLTAVNFIENNYKEAIYIEDVAERLKMTTKSFSRFFSKRAQKSFARFVVETRLANACRLLVENNLGISEICFACGFNNLSNFNRQFVKRYQINPLAYRKKYGEIFK